MPYPLNNVQTSDDYTDAATVQFHHGVSEAFALVTDAAVFVQLERLPPGLRVGAGSYIAEEYWGTGSTSIGRDYLFGSVRFRSAVPGTPARVTCR